VKYAPEAQRRKPGEAGQRQPRPRSPEDRAAGGRGTRKGAGANHGQEQQARRNERRERRRPTARQAHDPRPAKWLRGIFGFDGVERRADERVEADVKIR